MNIDIPTKSKIKIPNFTSLTYKVLSYDVLNDDIIKIYYNKLGDDYRIIKIKKVSDALNTKVFAPNASVQYTILIFDRVDNTESINSFEIDSVNYEDDGYTVKKM